MVFMFYLFIYLFLILFNPFSNRKIEKLDVWDANDFTNFNHQ